MSVEGAGKGTCDEADEGVESKRRDSRRDSGEHIRITSSVPKLLLITRNLY